MLKRQHILALAIIILSHPVLAQSTGGTSSTEEAATRSIEPHHIVVGPPGRPVLTCTPAQTKDCEKRGTAFCTGRGEVMVAVGCEAHGTGPRGDKPNGGYTCFITCAQM